MLLVEGEFGLRHELDRVKPGGEARGGSQNFLQNWYIVERLSGDTLSLYTFGSADFFLGLSVTFVLLF